MENHIPVFDVSQPLAVGVPEVKRCVHIGAKVGHHRGCVVYVQALDRSPSDKPAPPHFFRPVLSLVVEQIPDVGRRGSPFSRQRRGIKKTPSSRYGWIRRAGGRGRKGCGRSGSGNPAAERGSSIKFSGCGQVLSQTTPAEAHLGRSPHRAHPRTVGD